MSAANFDLEAAKYFLELAFVFLHLKKELFFHNCFYKWGKFIDLCLSYTYSIEYIYKQVIKTQTNIK